MEENEFNKYVNENYAFDQESIDELLTSGKQFVSHRFRIETFDELLALKEKSFVLPEGHRFYIHIQDQENPEEGGYFKIIPQRLENFPNVVVMKKPAIAEDAAVVFTQENIEDPTLTFELITRFYNNQPELLEIEEAPAPAAAGGGGNAAAAPPPQAPAGGIRGFVRGLFGRGRGRGGRRTMKKRSRKQKKSRRRN